MGRYVDLSEKVTGTYYDEQYEEWVHHTVTIEDILNAVCDDYTILPSAQSKTCEYWDGESNFCALHRSSAQPYALDEWCHDCKEYDAERHCCPRWNRVIKNTVDEVKQNAQPMRIKGRWIKGINENGVTTSLFCSRCNYENKHWYEWNFCPNCGAEMEGGE